MGVLNFFYKQGVNLLFLLVLGVSISACENDKNEIARVSANGDDANEQIKGLETLYSDSAVVRVRVTAPLLKKATRPKATTELPKGLLIEFFDEKMQPSSRLSAKYAIHYELEKRWEATNDVVVVNEKGDQLNTEKLVWDERKELLSSDQFVKITSAKEIIMGKGFEANQDFSKYRIFNVTGRITVKE